MPGKSNTKTWAGNILAFLEHVTLDEQLLPPGIRPLYPLQGENAAVTRRIVREFYTRFYDDSKPRSLIIGINPGRLGAGATGIPFTDTKRLYDPCGIAVAEFSTHEPSSVFVYEVIEAYGGPAAFYSDFYITSVCPVGFVKTDGRGKAVNYNYYDSRDLAAALEPYIAEKLREQIGFGARTDRAFCLGTGKNYQYLAGLNAKYGFFGEVVPLEHPRYVMQYKNRFRGEYVEKFLAAFAGRLS